MWISLGRFSLHAATGYEPGFPADNILLVPLLQSLPQLFTSFVNHSKGNLASSLSTWRLSPFWTTQREILPRHCPPGDWVLCEPLKGKCCHVIVHLEIEYFVNHSKENVSTSLSTWRLSTLWTTQRKMLPLHCPPGDFACHVLPPTMVYSIIHDTVT